MAEDTKEKSKKLRVTVDPIPISKWTIMVMDTSLRGRI